MKLTIWKYNWSHQSGVEKQKTMRKHCHSTHFSTRIRKDKLNIFIYSIPLSMMHGEKRQLNNEHTKKNRPNFFIFIFIRVCNLYSSFDEIIASTPPKREWMNGSEKVSANEDKIKNHILFDTWNITFLICVLGECGWVCVTRIFLQSFNL